METTEKRELNIKEIDLIGGVAKARISLREFDMRLIIEDIPKERSLLGIPINHIYLAKNSDDMVGVVHKLNVQERLTLAGDQYIYYDENDVKHTFQEYFYYYKSGTRDYINKELVELAPDGTMWYKHPSGK